MDKSKYIILGSLVCLITPVYSLCDNLSDAVDRILDDMAKIQYILAKTCDDTACMLEEVHNLVNETSHEAEEKMEKGITRPPITLSVEEIGQDGVKIACSGISGETVKAKPVTKHLFNIKTPEAEILIKLKGNMLSIKAEQEEKQDITENERTMHRWIQSHARIRHHTTHPLNLAGTNVDYQKDSQTLTITIPIAENNKPEILK